METGKRNTVKVRSLWNSGCFFFWPHNGCVRDSGLYLGQGGIDRHVDAAACRFGCHREQLWREEIGRQIEDEFREMQMIYESCYFPFGEMQTLEEIYKLDN